MNYFSRNHLMLCSRWSVFLVDMFFFWVGQNMISEKGRNTSRYGSASRRVVASGSRPSSSGEQGESRGSSRVASSGGGNRPSVFQRTQGAAAVSGYESKTASAFNRNRVAASRTARDEALRSFELLSIRKWNLQSASFCILDSSSQMLFGPLFPRYSHIFPVLCMFSGFCINFYALFIVITNHYQGFELNSAHSVPFLWFVVFTIFLFGFFKFRKIWQHPPLIIKLVYFLTVSLLVTTMRIESY